MAAAETGEKEQNIIFFPCMHRSHWGHFLESHHDDILAPKKHRGQVRERGGEIRCDLSLFKSSWIHLERSLFLFLVTRYRTPQKKGEHTFSFFFSRMTENLFFANENGVLPEKKIVWLMTPKGRRNPSKYAKGEFTSILLIMLSIHLMSCGKEPEIAKRQVFDLNNISSEQVEYSTTFSPTRDEVYFVRTATRLFSSESLASSVSARNW